LNGLKLVTVLLAALFVAAFVSTDHFRAFGGAPGEATLARMKLSPRFHGDHFENAEPTTMMKAAGWEMMKRWLFGKEVRSPTCALPIASDTAARLASPSASGLRITWLGHSTTLVEIDGMRILTDPIWSERASPSRWVGPRRFHPPPLALADLPHLDAVVISHDHYDHLDMETVRALAARGVPFHVALGVGAHLEAFGVASAQIVEHDWWEGTKLPNGFEIVSTPSRHFSGRGVPGRVGTLWTSWALIGPSHRVFFSGDTGLTEAFREVAARVGPFDVALLEIGQYSPDWGDIHLGPAGALEAHAMLGAKHLVPIHWGTFELAYHTWSEPAETLAGLAAARAGTSLFTPRPGEPIEPTLGTPTSPWWRALPPLAAGCPDAR
jgi:L-ascorbate metabolism protein UlaG (beta-lactamase superfamily)